jgi:hypothetical protein
MYKENNGYICKIAENATGVASSLSFVRCFLLAQHVQVVEFCTRHQAGIAQHEPQRAK